MRVLLLTETAPWPLDSGGRIKTWHTLHALAREHEVHCHAFVRTPAQREAAMGALQHACASVSLHLVPRSPVREGWYATRALGTGLPFTVTRHFAPRVMREIARTCRDRRIELLYGDHLSMFEYCRRLDLPVVHDAHNVEHRIVSRHLETLSGADPRRAVLASEARRLERYERRMYRLARLIFAVSEVDAADISALSGGVVPVVPVPIAIDAGNAPPVERITDTPQILFVGALDWPPNADAVDYWLREIWPRVRARRPDATFVAVGRGGTSLARRWGGMPGVRFTGWVHEVDSWFQSSRVTVVPLRAGSGMRVKILDAFVRGVPVVTTSIGIEGIEARRGVHALIEDDAAMFASAVVRVLDDREFAQGLAESARALVLERYDRPVVARRLLDALRDVLNS